ncbi:uncharacterized protein LOC111398433 [Olea europaea var. sylvestris]|uniref:uncharacterized protein LOC111398433 n=1 Tax=Olea europaea var. sylvestris TaxID=158386 RepID=UPI000C1CCC71|nr:uncharacterized protein LOC111398433 [Olea europaea var. sylvestris]
MDSYSGQFLGYIVDQREIEANPVKIVALLEMRSPQKSKEVQSLSGQIAALSRFISKATDNSLPFFSVLKQGKKFQWTSECEEAFQALKMHLGEASFLSKPQPEESLLLYLVVSDVAVSAILVREENDHQLPVYYDSKVLLPTETRYPDMEKLALALITASRKLSKFDLLSQPRHAIKGQALADFVVEFTKTPEMEAIMEPVEPPTWKLFVDGSSREAGSGAGIILESPEGHKLNSAFKRFELIQVPRPENKHADALSKLAASKDSELLKVVPIEHLSKPSISGGEEVLWIEGTPLWMPPIITYLKNQTQPASRSEVSGSFAAKNSSMVVYLKLVLDLVPQFKRFELIQVPRPENKHADALSKLAASKDSELLKVVPIEHLLKPSISGGEEVLLIESTPLWMPPIIAYLKNQTLPASRSEARKLRRRAAHFVLQKDMLYKRRFASLLLRCVRGEEATYILRKIHEEITPEERPWHTRFFVKAIYGRP